MTAGVASLAKSVLEYHGGFLYVRLHGGDVVALFLEKRENPPPAGSVPSEQGQSRFLGFPGSFLYVRL